ncbi:hypothetical protein [Metabacillus bambusae]|nr:hypothetical protein [Metabacillus bambusae]
MTREQALEVIGELVLNQVLKDKEYSEGEILSLVDKFVNDLYDTL